MNPAEQHNDDLAVIAAMIGIFILTFGALLIWSTHRPSTPLPKTSPVCADYGRQAERIAQQRIARFGPNWRAADEDPGLKLDHPRQLALMHALVRFANIAAANTFTTQEVSPTP